MRKLFSKMLTLYKIMNVYCLKKHSVKYTYIFSIVNHSSFQKTFNVLLKCTFLSYCFYHGTKKKVDSLWSVTTDYNILSDI